MTLVMIPMNPTEEPFAISAFSRCDGQSLGSGGLAHRGAAVAAEWLVAEYGEALRFLEEPLGPKGRERWGGGGKWERVCGGKKGGG